MIAMALATNPELLIADEPTTALDVTIQAQILELMKELRERNRMAVMLITHDLGVIAEMADDVVVMYAGKIVESGPTSSPSSSSPHHPYTQGLLASIPAPRRAARAPRGHRGRGAEPAEPARRAACSSGAARYAMPICDDAAPAPARWRRGHLSRCWLTAGRRAAGGRAHRGRGAKRPRPRSGGAVTRRSPMTIADARLAGP